MEELMYATDSESELRRQELINAGLIKVSSDVVSLKNGDVSVSTKSNRYKERLHLISKGMIKVSLCNLRPENVAERKEEGEYKSRVPQSDAEYVRRKAAYFRMLQEVLYSRRELNLILGRKDEKDPEWFF